ncbi:MAG: alpha/beta fold hydrolase [Oleiphilaceae bacterium]|nr:alpha/beta fold hydrolase [Oleiphilaceae bacterium]
MIKKALLFSAFLLVAVVCLVLVLAYGYRPAEPARQSGFLLDHGYQTVDTPDFQFNSLQMGTGHPVVLIHGAGTWSYSFRHTITALSGSGAIYSFDMPGHGYTRVKKDLPRYDLPTMSRAIEAYLDASNLQSVSLVGHSFGGGWALYFALQHPERVEKLVLMAPRALDVPYKWEWQLMKYPVFGELFSKWLRREDVHRGLQDAFYNPDAITDEMVDNLFLPLQRTENRRAQYRLVRDSDWSQTQSEMASLEVPTWVLWGDSDQYLPASQLETFRNRIPHVKTRIFRQCGHLLHVECAERINPVLKDILFNGTGPTAR